MLTITSLVHSNATYLTNDRAPEVVAITGTSPSRWHGSLALGFGLHGDVARTDLEALYEGRAPQGTLRSRSSRSILGWDLVFAAPKSASVVFSSSNHDVARAAITAHECAVDAALAYLERNALTMQRRAVDGGVLWPERIATARFTHGLSRALDPHLHSHVCLPNFAHAGDGRFGAIDARGLRAHRSGADAIYRAVLRHELSHSLDLAYARLSSGMDRITCISRAHELALSHRSTEIRQGRHDRDPKISPSREDLERRWRDQERIVDDLAEQVIAPARPYVDEHRFAAAVDVGGFRPREIVAALCDAAASGLSASTIEYLRQSWPQGQERGVYEQALLRERCVPSPTLLRALGPRPSTLIDLERWERARLVIERGEQRVHYRDRGLVREGLDRRER